jgi:hypothetical protein
MRNVPKPTTKGFEAQLESAFQAARADRNNIKPFKDLARQHPMKAAEVVCKAIPRLMQRVRAQVSEFHGVDIACEGWKEQFKQKQHSDAEVGLLLMAANYYLVYSWCQSKLDEYAADNSLSKKEWAAKVCKVGVDALRGTEAVLLHTLQEMLTRTSGEAATLVKNELALRLAGELPTRISIDINKRLAKGLDEIRDHNKPAKRERLEALWRELYALAPASWADHHVADWQLEATRSAVLKKIEQHSTPPAATGKASQTEELELAEFAEHEKREQLLELLEKGRDVGLPPREYKLLALVVNDPRRFLNNNGNLRHREAAKKLGVAVGTSKSLWSRITKTLNAA